MQRFNFKPLGPTPVITLSKNGKEQYQYKCPKCSRKPVYTSYKCYQNAIERGCCRKCMGIGSHTCSRCNITTPYISRESFERAEANLKNCSKCQNIPDESIKFLHDEGKYGKLCPNCGQPQFYPNKIGLFQALRLNSWCSSCATKVCAPMNQIKIKARRENMTPEQRKIEDDEIPF